MKKQIKTLVNLPDPPEGMNQEAKTYFLSIGRTLIESGRFAGGDEQALARLCHLYSVSDRLEKEMNDAWSEKLVKQNMPLYDKIIKNLLSLETAFQMNPGARYRGKIQHDKEKRESPEEKKLRELMGLE
jgi:phage terminase small subunit